MRKIIGRAVPLALGAVLATCSAPAPGSRPGARESAQAPEEAEAFSPGPAVGTPLPELELPDQDGVARSLQSLFGPEGLLLNINRSVVW